MKIIGQPSVLKYLTSSLHSNRLATSFLFLGPEGVGKRTVAVSFAEALFCSEVKATENSETIGGCGRCANCQKINTQSHSDVFFLNPQTQAALLKEKLETQRSVKIEAIREVDKFLQLKPLEGRHRLAIIENADTMTVEGSNALLKTLEEPPENGRLILIAKDSRSLPSTILSRCAVVRFRPISETLIAQWLNKNQGASAEDAIDAAAKSGGSFSKAITALNQEPLEGSFEDLQPDDFFSMLGEPAFRKEGRERAEKLIQHLLEKSRRQLEGGAVDQSPIIRNLLRAEQQLGRNVTPRVVLESVFVALRATKRL